MLGFETHECVVEDWVKVAMLDEGLQCPDSEIELSKVVFGSSVE